MTAAEKTERVMGALMDHLRGKYPSMSSSNVFRLQTNAAGTLTLILDLLSPKIDTESPKTIDANANDVQFLRDVNCGLQYLPTFQIVFTPMAIVSDQDSPPPSSRTLFNVLLVNYQGTVLKKDFMTFYVNFPEEVIEAAKAAALEEAGASADDPDVDIVVDPDVELADKTSSNCELLHKLDRYREFRLCCGVRKNRKCPQIRPGSVFVEPFGDSRSNFVVRARECIFMLELENASNINREPSTTPENCHSCQVMESKLTEVGIDRLKTLSRVKVEVKDETSGATLVLPIETVGGEVGGDAMVAGTELLAVVDVDQDGTVIQRQSEIIGPGDMDDDTGVGIVMDDIMEGKENASKVSVVKTGDPNNPTEFKCESCDKVFKFIDSYWKHAKKCGRESIGGGAASKKLSAEQQQMMVTLKGEDTKNTCSNCGRDFFHEVNWRKHEEMCKIGRVKRRSIYKQEVDETGQVVKRPRPKPRPKKPKVEGVEGGEGGEEESKDMKAPKEVKECLICLKKVGNQWERHIKLHKERVGDKLYEQTVCPSWDCEQIFEDRISLNKHFLENHDVEAIPCVYCVRLILKDRIQQHLRNEHPHMSHMCTECGRECIYPSALKQHIKECHGTGEDEATKTQHMCDLCGKVFRRAHGLRYHVQGVHQKRRDFVCPHCGKKFLINSKLTEHLRIHTGEKPFKCFACDYRSNRHGNVRLHVKKVHKILNPNNEEHLIIDPALDMGEVDGGQMVTYVGVEETAVVSSTEQIHHDHGGVTTTVAVQEVVRDVDGSEIARVVDASGSGPHRVVEYKIIHDSQMSAVSADTGEVITAQVLEPVDEVVEEEEEEGETVVEVREAPPHPRPGSEQIEEEIQHQEEVVAMKEEEEEEVKSIQQPTRSSRRSTVLPERLRD